MPAIPLDVNVIGHGTSPFLYVAAAVGVTKTVSDVIARHPGPITGYQYAQAGGQYMDETLKILRDKERGEKALDPAYRHQLLVTHSTLAPVRNNLEEGTRSYTGSIKNWNASRNFHNEAFTLHADTRSSSDEGVTNNLKALAQTALQRTDSRDYRPPNQTYPYDDTRNPQKQGPYLEKTVRPQTSSQGHNSQQPPSGYGHVQQESRYSRSTTPKVAQTSNCQWAQYMAAATPPKGPSSSNAYPPAASGDRRYY